VLDGQLFRCHVPPKQSDSTTCDPWKLEGVKPEDVIRMEVMKAERATALFGDWASGGAIFIVTRASSTK